MLQTLSLFRLLMMLLLPTLGRPINQKENKVNIVSIVIPTTPTAIDV